MEAFEGFPFPRKAGSPLGRSPTPVPLQPTVIQITFSDHHGGGRLGPGRHNGRACVWWATGSPGPGHPSQPERELDWGRPGRCRCTCPPCRGLATGQGPEAPPVAAHFSAALNHHSDRTPGPSAAEAMRHARQKSFTLVHNGFDCQPTLSHKNHGMGRVNQPKSVCELTGFSPRIDRIFPSVTSKRYLKG